MRRRLAVLTALLLAALCIPFPAPADQQPPEKYAAAVTALDRWLTDEVAAKSLPALSIALVDDQTVVWSRGFGWQDRDARTVATGDTLYRVGSVSKPFTTLLLMILVEMGAIDLDAPVRDYLPEFQPVNKSDKKITLRQMVSHRSGLVRESPVGNYFDETGPSLADTVKSVNGLDLVYEPETKTSYSNAALATVGYLLERTQKEPFAQLMQRRLLDPIGMTDSSFDPPPALRKRLARSLMWSYHGREFPAPTFDLGMAPAGSLYSTVNDQAKFLKLIFAGGKTADGKQLLKRETLDKMWQIQFAKKDDKSGFGLSFMVSDFDGKRRIGHGGAIYGFATELGALPDDKLGVIVCSARDVSNAVTRHAADVALRHLLAVRAGKPLPTIERTEPVGKELARSLAGRYQAGDKTVELYQRDGRLWAFPHRGGMKLELRMLGKDLISDDWLGYGGKIILKDGALVIGTGKDETVYRRVETPRPAPCPAKWGGIIGEYGPNHNVLKLLEKDGDLYALIEWVFLYPLHEISENVYQFPDYGLYHGDRLVFKRDASGKCTEVIAASVPFKRRPLPRAGETFQIPPTRPLAELLKVAKTAIPPEENRPLMRKADLLDVTALDKTIKLDIRYASTNNFLGAPFYGAAKAFMQKPAAEALVRVHKQLDKQGYGLLIHDAYRPWYVTKTFWDATPPEFHHFVADPAQGSRHNRGCAVDLTLYDRQTGTAVPMVGGYDEFSDRSYPDYLGGTSLQRWHRDLLRSAMEAEGFDVYEAEWWHFDYRDWRHYPVLNLTFEDLIGCCND
jgi:CubicO group peptidase (beta-lactamase class C family)/D-alanyl-D-alanine dipeptidase